VNKKKGKMSAEKVGKIQGSLRPCTGMAKQRAHEGTKVPRDNRRQKQLAIIVPARRRRIEAVLGPLETTRKVQWRDEVVSE